jgi:membrane protease YdiL (CAAX protease family)
VQKRMLSTWSGISLVVFFAIAFFVLTAFPPAIPEEGDSHDGGDPLVLFLLVLFFLGLPLLREAWIRLRKEKDQRGWIVLLLGVLFSLPFPVMIHYVVLSR